jgi:hypothetical protein
LARNRYEATKSRAGATLSRVSAGSPLWGGNIVGRACTLVIAGIETTNGVTLALKGPSGLVQEDAAVVGVLALEARVGGSGAGIVRLGLAALRAKGLDPSFCAEALVVTTFVRVVGRNVLALVVAAHNGLARVAGVTLVLAHTSAKLLIIR